MSFEPTSLKQRSLRPMPSTMTSLANAWQGNIFHQVPSKKEGPVVTYRETGSFEVGEAVEKGGLPASTVPSARDKDGDDVVGEQMKADPGQAWSQASTCRYRHRRPNMGREKQAAYHRPVMAESAPRPGHHRSPAECLSDHNRSPPRSF